MSMNAALAADMRRAANVIDVVNKLYDGGTMPWTSEDLRREADVVEDDDGI